MKTDTSIYSTYEFQYPKMTEDEVWEFMSTPSRDVYIATVGKDGIPHCTTIWVTVHQKKIYFNAFTNPPKKRTRNIMSNPNVCLTAAVTPDGDGSKVYGAAITGVAKIIDDPGKINAVQQTAKEQRAKLGKAPIAAASGPWATQMQNQAHIWIEVTPTKIASWDKRKRVQIIADMSR